MGNEVILGYGRPRLVVVGVPQSGYGSHSYLLPPLNQEGLDEANIPEKITHTLAYERRVIQKIIGVRKRFTLHYEGYIPGQDCLNIQAALDFEIAGRQLRFYPRDMNMSYKFEVFCSNAELVLKTMRGKFPVGMKGLTLEFTTNKVYPKYGWTSIENLNNLQENVI